MSRLFLVGHGQSIWKLQNRFTGWVDVSLNQQGVSGFFPCNEGAF